MSSLPYCIGAFRMTSSKYDYANYDQFPSTFGMACKTILHVSVSNLKSFGPSKTELWVKEVEEFFIMLFGKVDRWEFFCTPSWLP